MGPEDVLDAKERMEIAEKDVARSCDELILMISGHAETSIVYTNPPHRMMQSKGVPDRRYRVYGTCLYFELKAPNGQLSEEQYHFLNAELDHECFAACGGLQDLKRALEVIRADRGKLRPAVAIAECRRIIGTWAARGFRGKPKRQTLTGASAK